jgi:thymidine kinase
MLYLIAGPMFSGKSTELIRRASRQRVVSQDCLLVGYRKDVERYNDGKTGVRSHSGWTYDKDFIYAETVQEIVHHSLFAEASHVFVDEAQFFHNLIELWDNCDTLNKTLVLAGLDVDSGGQMFHEIMSIMPYAIKTFMTAVCYRCKRDGATLTERVDGDTSGEQKIGGNDLYRSVCVKCKQIK